METATFNQVEVRKWGTGNGEVITTYPHPNIRLIWTKGTAGVTSVEAQALHRDQLGSVRAVTTFKPLVAGAALSTLRREAATYKPFGEQTEVLQPTQENPEQKGWTRARYDADAGLQFLNARYYDPEYGFFLQPDWFEVTQAGVGTNRYSYSFNDPINKMDPGGNSWLDRGWDAVFGGGSFNSTFGDSGSRWSDRTFGNEFEQDYAKFHAAAAADSTSDGEFSRWTYDQAKEGFFKSTISANGQAASGDGVFGIFSAGAGVARWAVGKAMAGPVAKLTARQIGDLGETAVRSAFNIGPKELTKMFGRNRFPDGILPSVLSEVKNVARLSYTRQLKDYAKFAGTTARDFHLYVRPSTVLSRPLQEAVRLGQVIVRYIP